MDRRYQVFISSTFEDLIDELRATIAGYEKEKAETKAAAVLEVDKNFAHGTETIEITLTHSGFLNNPYTRIYEEGTLLYTWDEITELIGPYMLDEASGSSLRDRLDYDILRAVLDSDEGDWSPFTKPTAKVNDNSWGTIIVQLRALGLIQTGTKRRQVNDKHVYWKLTPAGDDYLVALRTIPHDPNFAAAEAE